MIVRLPFTIELNLQLSDDTMLCFHFYKTTIVWILFNDKLGNTYLNR